MDGNTIGRPCCKEHNCTQPLVKHRAHFCARHESKKFQCVVTDCDINAEEGFHTCTTASHCEIEMRRNEKGKAFFQPDSLPGRLSTFNT